MDTTDTTDTTDVTTELARILETWKVAHDLSTAYVERGDARAALTAAGIAVEAPPGDDEAPAPRDVVAIEGPVDDGWDARARAAARFAGKALLVLVPAGGAPGARPIGDVAAKLWAVGRVRERAAYAYGARLAAKLPAFVRARLAHREAFLVDVAPRTPQAKRRRLRQAP